MFEWEEIEAMEWWWESLNPRNVFEISRRAVGNESTDSEQGIINIP